MQRFQRTAVAIFSLAFLLWLDYGEWLTTPSTVPVSTALDYVIAEPISASTPPIAPNAHVVITKEFEFVPNVVELKPGQPTTLTIVNRGKETHNIIIPKLKITSSLAESGQSISIILPSLSVGRYPFYCGVGNHKALGMSGVLIVN